MADNGQFLLFFPQGNGVTVDVIELFLELEILFLQPEHFLYLLEAAPDGKDQEQGHQHQHPQSDQGIDLDGRLEQLLGVQDEIPLVGMVVTQQQGHRPQIRPEGRPRRSQLFRGEEPSHDLQGQGHPQEKQEKINAEIRQAPVHMPGIRQEQLVNFQGQGMDEDHIDGLEPQYE